MRKGYYNVNKEKMEDSKKIIKGNEREDFFITRVVTRDVIRDSFQGIRNFFGLRLRSYENMINKAARDLLEEARMQYDISWYRFNVNPMDQTDAVIVVIYGQGKYKEELKEILKEAEAIE